MNTLKRYIGLMLDLEDLEARTIKLKVRPTRESVIVKMHELWYKLTPTDRELVDRINWRIGILKEELFCARLPTRRDISLRQGGGRKRSVRAA